MALDALEPFDRRNVRDELVLPDGDLLFRVLRSRPLGAFFSIVYNGWRKTLPMDMSVCVTLTGVVNSC